jgi:glycosyltransferase involved in cell wall biosynthesis
MRRTGGDRDVSALTLAANNGSIGGGEVMLLQMAESARDLGVAVTVIAPGKTSELTTAARKAGLPTVALPAEARPAYLRQLRAWDRREREGLLWCNGLAPALATAGHPHRVVHLHQVPRGFQSMAARAARWRSELVVVPSRYMATQVRSSTVMANWTAGAASPPGLRPRGGPPWRVGFLGRLSQDKGVDVLARAVAQLNERVPGYVELVVAGDYRFVPPDQVSVVRDALSALGPALVELGWVERQEFLSRVDIAVFPSVWDESFGLVVAEAMAAGVPFAVSDAGALPEVAGHDHPWVAPAGDPVALANVVESMLTAEVGSATDRARRRWEREYSPAAGAKRFAHVLDTLGVTRSAHR